MGIYASMCKLTAYLRDSRLTQAQFAAQLGVDQATISKICSGKLMPSLPLAVKIDRTSGGAVSVYSWVPSSSALPSPEVAA